MGRAKPDVRPPVAAIPSAKSISIAEIPLAAMAVGLQRIGGCAAPPASHRCRPTALGIAASGGLTSGFAVHF